MQVCIYRYGPIYLVSLGSVSGVVLNNMCTISDAFEGKAHIFSDRPNWLPLMNLIYQERGRPAVIVIVIVISIVVIITNNNR